MKNDRRNRNRKCVILCVLFILTLQSGAVAGPFGLFGRRRGGGGDGNIPGSNNAPVAPANLSPCTTGNCPAPTPYVPMVPIPIESPTFDPPALKIEQSVLVKPAEVERLERIYSAIETKLGLEKSQAIKGDPSAVMKKLPVISLEIRTQEGEVTDSVQLDTREWVIQQLSK
ncbi:MAG: hypothetical protein ABGX16_07815 [Pirellulales bacterium]